LLLTPILDALSTIHANDILHRDLAPDNIYVCDDGSPVLLDFGSAREAIAQRTKTISSVVKTGYSPPEQYSTTGKSQGPWTDIYALGATLYHAVAGKPPDEASDRVLTDDLVPATRAARRVYRAGFLEAIDWALRVDTKRRPQSVSDWRKALLDDRGSFERAAAAPTP
jgi:serine/threonine protein kinase